MTEPVEVCVGRIGKAHGLRGEVSVEVRTDEPERRFVLGATLRLRGKHPHLPPVVVIEAIRRHQDRLLMRLDAIGDRTAAESARGALLYVDLEADEAPEDPEEFYDHQLVGLRAEDTTGTMIGTVSEVLHNGGQDLLVIRVDDGAGATDDPGSGHREVLVPFVTALVPVVDTAAGRLVVADRPGLLSEGPEAER